MKQLILEMLDNSHDGLMRTAQAVPDDKMLWQPLDLGRTVLDLLGDAAQTSEMVARLVESRGADKPSRESFAQARAARAGWTREATREHLETNHARLQTALEACSEDELAAPITIDMGRSMTMPLGGWAMMAYRTYTARFAQINYIQTLYGDFEGH